MRRVDLCARVPSPGSLWCLHVAGRVTNAAYVLWLLSRLCAWPGGRKGRGWLTRNALLYGAGMHSLLLALAALRALKAIADNQYNAFACRREGRRTHIGSVTPCSSPVLTS